MWREFFSTVLLLCSLVVHTHGQATRIYDNRDYGFGELSSNLTNSISQDKEGFIWTGTEYGLNKFDGIRFVQYMHDVQDSTSVCSNNISKLFMDRNQRLWVGCNNGLQYYDINHDNFVRIQFPNHIAPHITDIIHRFDGSLWITTSGWGLFSIDLSKRRAISLSGLNTLVGGMFGRTLFEDSKKNIWIAVDQIGLSCVSADLKHVQHFEKSNLPQPKGGNFDILQAQDGRLIFASPSQIGLFDQKNKSVQEIIFKDSHMSPVSEIQLSQTKHNQLIISTEGDGLWYADLTSSTPTAIRAELSNLDKDYRHGRIRTFLQDREKNLWLGWFQRGLVFIPVPSKQFEFWRILDLEESDKKNIKSIARDKLGNIWYAVENKGIFRSDSLGLAHQQISDQHDITQLTSTQDGQLWFSSYSKGLGRIDIATTAIHYLDICPDQQVLAFALGQDNHTIYISTFGHGFVEYDTNTRSGRNFSMTQAATSGGVLANDWIYTILCSKNGLIWLGHHKGLSCYDPKHGRFLDNFIGEKLSEQISISLLEDLSGQIWAGTYNGLYRIDPKTRKISSFTTNNGLSSNVISGLGKDKEGNIWCSTFKGINCLNYRSSKVINYYTGDGLVDRYYSRGVYYQDSSGKIYYGGKQGITSFHPSKIQLKAYPYQILITNLYVKNSPIKPGVPPGKHPIYVNNLNDSENLFFNNDDDSFTLELSTMDFNSPENVHYEYRIKGINKTWNATLPGVNLITYNNLAAGSHELEIRACKFGAYSPIRLITLHVLPPWYQSGTAYFIYCILLLGLILLITKYIHERRLEKLHAYKLQLFTDISHEIRTPLTLVISPMDKLIHNASDDQTKTTLLNMNRNAQRILNLVNQLLDVRKLESGHLNLYYTEIDAVAFIQSLLDAFEQQASARQITLRLHSNNTPISIWVDSSSFEKILNNIISNAFKFTPDGGFITVDLSKKSDHSKNNILEITISDTGTGIPDKDIQQVFRRFYQSSNTVQKHSQGSGIGLHLAKVLVEMHGGKIYAENRTDCTGSRFVIQLPQGNADSNKQPVTEFKSTTTISKSNNEKVIAEPRLSPRPAYQKTPFKALIVDDDKDILDYLKQELSPIYKIYTAENGSDAFQLALSQLPDIIISDVSMPDMDGFTLVKKVKSNSMTNHIPVILLTAKSNQEDRIEGIGMGADSYLTKPFMIDELLIVAENLIKNRMKVKGKFSGAQEQEGKIKTISFKSSDELLMERIVKTVNTYLENPEFNVQFLADEVGLSRVQLHRKVKSLTGISTGEFIRNMRLRQAEKLLLEKRMNISQVAYALGFTNQTHFTTLFKKMYGLSPTDYIQRHIQEDN